MIKFTVLYFFWHYTSGIKEFFAIYKNFNWFLFHFFSIETLSKTFLKPWKMMSESYEGGFHPEGVFESFIVNTLMRLVGAFIKFFVILAGIISLLLLFILFIFLFVIWLVLPIVIPIMIISSIKLIFKS